MVTDLWPHFIQIFYYNFYVTQTLQKLENIEQIS